MIYALTGFKQSGKSTAAKHLESKGFTRLNFKDALVEEMKERLPDTLRALQALYSGENSRQKRTVDWLFEVKPPLMRALMQNYGTNVRRGDKDNYWTEKWGMAYAAMHPTNVVTDDVRFLNEAEAIRQYGGIIIRIERTDITSGGNHVSETEQLQIEADHTISVKLGEHDKLYAELDKILV